MIPTGGLRKVAIIMGKSEKEAIIGTGGKQYRVHEGDVISVELLAAAEGDNVSFDKVLLVKDGAKVSVGRPSVEGASVTGKILELEKGEKLIVFKKKRRKSFQKSTGHRQKYHKVEIEKISLKAASKGTAKSSDGDEKQKE
jgi:large subunit ribosomal protein L21